MSRSVRLAFGCVACFLVLLPLSLKKPGLPIRLAGEEATYLSMASSLAAGGDLVCDRADLRRLFNEFPYTEARLELASDDGWATARFARPVIYPLLAAPFVALWGANGALALNAIFFLVALACGWFCLRRVSSDGAALLFALGFFLFSAAFAYLFRIQPQVMVMAAVAVALNLGWQPRDRSREGPGLVRRGWLSGAALGIAVLQQPDLALLAVPLLAALAPRRETGEIRPWRAAAGWLAGCGATVAAGALASIVLTGNAWADHLERADTAAAFTVDNPLVLPWQDPEALEAARPAEAEPRRSFMDLLEDSFFFVWGRRHGILPYFPLVVPILLLFGTAGGRRRQEWLLLATLAALGTLQLILEPAARALHQDQVGNPHMTGIYAAFLFLVPRLGRAVTVAAYALGALVLGPLVTTTLGVVVPGADLHAHTRNYPLRLLPFEYPALGRTSGFHRLELHGLEAAGARLWAPTDRTEVNSDELWLLGGESVELWLESRAEIASAVLQLRNLATGNRITLRMAGEEITRDLEQVAAGGESFRTELTPGEPDKVRRDAGGALYVYRLELETRLGEKPKWRQSGGPNHYLGVALAFLGSRELLDRDLYATEWLGCGAPPRVAPGEQFLAAARLRNASPHAWPDRGPARVRLSYRWLDAGGRKVAHAGLRTELADRVEPGREIASWISVQAPGTPGAYVLELDPVFENVAWFSNRDPGATCRVEITVAPDRS